MTIISVDLDALYQNPWQPRRHINPDDVRALADNIQAIGRVLHVPNVRPNTLQPGTYQIAEGHQRIEALKLLHAEAAWPSEADVNCELLSDTEMAEIALSENRHRTDVTPLDELYAWRAALDIDGMSVRRLAETARVDRTTIQKRLPILSLPDVVLGHIDSSALGIEVAREFVALMNHNHTHEDVIEAVIAKCLRRDNNPDRSNGYLNAEYRPDFRRHAVRDAIEDVIRGDDEVRKGWRIVDTTGHHYYTDPSFDLDAFRAEHELQVHTIPSGDKSALWTCAVKEWTRAQTAATKTDNEKRPAERRKDGRPQASKWLKRVREDPVVVEVLGKHKASRLGAKEPEGDLGRNLDADTRARLGQRIKKGTGIELPRMAYPEGMETYGLYNTEVFPGFDYEECRTCPMAGWHERTWDPPSLRCRDKKRYEEKKSLGIEAWTRAFDAAKKVAAVEDLNAEAALRSMLDQVDPNVLEVTVRALWRAIRGMDYVDAFDSWPKGRFWPQPALDFAKLLGVSLPPVNSISYNSADDFRTQVVDRLYTADRATRVSAAALMGAWANRIARGLDVGGVARPHPSKNGARAEETAGVPG